jgi:hypothetical protein
MPPSPRYTVRLPHALDTQVQARVQAGTPFAVLIREALSAYLADSLPTPAPTDADRPLTVGMPTPADNTDSVQELRVQVDALTARVEMLGFALATRPIPRRQYADRSADTVPTDADSDADTSADSAPTDADTPTPPRRPGRPSGPMRQQILEALQAHPGGLRAEELRVCIQARRPIGDTLQGMLKGGVIVAQGRGSERRYVVGTIPS